MKYVSLDIETTGLSKENCQVLQIALVVDDLQTPIEQLPKLSLFVAQGIVSFEPYALQMHVKSGLLKRWGEDTKKVNLIKTVAEITKFLDAHYPIGDKEKYNFAGKNLAGFDLPFLNYAYDGATRFISSFPSMAFLGKISHRVIDPAVFFTDLHNDKGAVSLDECKKRANVSNTPVTHDALDDAMDVVHVVRAIAERNLGRFSVTHYAENT